MAKFKLVFRPEKCKACELCINACPKNILGLSDNVNLKGYRTATILDQESCIGCASCAWMCPDGAIEIFKEDE